MVELDIKKDDGSLVYYTKEQTVRCLSGVSKSYTESFSPDGHIDDFSITPGRVGQQYKESGHIYIPTEYDKPLYEGESFTRKFSCTWYDSFIGKTEYWEQRQHHPSSDVTVRILFPEKRPPQEYWVEHKHGSTLKETNLEAIKSISNRRTYLELFIPEPIYLHSYVLKWKW